MSYHRLQMYEIQISESRIFPDMAIRLEKAFGGSADVWLRVQAAYDLAQARTRENCIDVRRYEAV